MSEPKSIFFKKAYWALRHQVRKIHWRYKYKCKEPIIARHACLGADVLHLLQPGFEVVNVQKGRIDYLLKCWEHPEQRAKASKVYRHLKRNEIIGCVIQEEILFDWVKPVQPAALFMDSMAELADQEFEHRSGKWAFLSSYTDVDHTENFKKKFSPNGLLPTESLNSYFKTFFKKIRDQYPSLPVFYLHFPYKLESRKKFIKRGIDIKNILDQMASEDPLLFSLSVGDDVVDWDEFRTEEMRDFAYHYNEATYKAFAKAILATGHWPIRNK